MRNREPEGGRSVWQPDIRKFLRNFVLFTSHGPLLTFYLWIYRAIAGVTARHMGADPKVRSVYLRRGCAKGETVPAVSDIDLAIVTRSSDRAAEEQIRRRYANLKRLFVPLDASPDILDAATFQANQRTIRYRYRLAEGKATWQTLAGADDLTQLPDPIVSELESSLYYELQYWWALFSREVLQSINTQRDEVNRNAFCYKTVAEFLKVRLALLDRVLVFRRQEAFERSEPGLAEEERLLVDRLRLVARGRFRDNNPEILQDTLNFLLRFLDRIHPVLATDSHFATPDRQQIEVDGPRREWYWGPNRAAYLQAQIRQADTLWPNGVRSVFLSKGSDFSVNDFALILELAPGFRLHQEDVLRWREFQASDSTGEWRRFHVYLLLSSCAVQIDLDGQRGAWESSLRGIISPLLNPEVFASMARPENVLRGQPRPFEGFAGWTRALGELTSERRRASEKPLSDEEHLRNWGCYGAFSKGLQLRLLELAGTEKTVTYALTPQAIQRAATARNLELPKDLARLLRLDDPRFDQTNVDPAVAAEAREWLTKLGGLAI